MAKLDQKVPPTPPPLQEPPKKEKLAMVPPKPVENVLDDFDDMKMKTEFAKKKKPIPEKID